MHAYVSVCVLFTYVNKAIYIHYLLTKSEGKKNFDCTQYYFLFLPGKSGGSDVPVLIYKNNISRAFFNFYQNIM